jgi:hypothetical protein
VPSGQKHPSTSVKHVFKNRKKHQKTSKNVTFGGFEGFYGLIWPFLGSFLGVQNLKLQCDFLTIFAIFGAVFFDDFSTCWLGVCWAYTLVYFLGSFRGFTL